MFVFRVPAFGRIVWNVRASRTAHELRFGFGVKFYLPRSWIWDRCQACYLKKAGEQDRRAHAWLFTPDYFPFCVWGKVFVFLSRSLLTD
jgi:hypothetical protein